MPIDVLKAIQKKFMEDELYCYWSCDSFFITEHVEQRIDNLTDYFTTSFSKDYKKLPAEYSNIVQILKELPPTKYAVSFLTGYGEKDPANTATFVKLYDTELDMVVGKALLSYYNSECVFLDQLFSYLRYQKNIEGRSLVLYFTMQLKLGCD